MGAWVSGQNGVENGSSIISAIGHERGRRRVQLRQQSLNMRGVIDVFVGQIKRHDIPAAGVNADMKLLPGAAFGRPVLFKQPFASAAQFQSGAVDDQLKIAGLVSPGRFRRQSTRPPAQRRMIRDGQVDLQHSHDRTNQPFALAKRQSKHRSQSQRGFDGKVRIMTLTAGVVRGCAFRPAIASGVTRLLGFRDCGGKRHIRASL